MGALGRWVSTSEKTGEKLSVREAFRQSPFHTMDLHKGLALLLHTAEVFVIQGVQNDFDSVSARNFSLGDGAVGVRNVHPLGLRQHPNGPDFPVIEYFQQLQGGFVAGIHPAQGGGHLVHVPGAHAQGGPGVADFLEGVQDLKAILPLPQLVLKSVRGQGFAHGRQVIVQEGCCVGLVHQPAQEFLCLVCVLEEGGKGDLVPLPPGGNGGARGDTLRCRVPARLIQALVVVLECVVSGG